MAAYDDAKALIGALRETRREAVKTVLLANNAHNRQALVDVQAAIKASYEIEQDEKGRSK